MPADAARGARRRAARGRCCSPTSTSTTPARAARWCSAGPISRSTSTSAARRTWSTRRGCGQRARLYGEDMDRLWGEMLPVPEANLRVLTRRRDDARRRLRGGLHAGPRLASRLLPARRARRSWATSAACGSRPTSLTIPPTPPPDIDVEAWHESIELVRGLAARAAGDDPLRRQRGRRARSSTSSARRLDAGRARPRRATEERVHRRACSAEIERDGAARARPLPTSRPRRPSSCTPGYERYWRKRAEARRRPGRAAAGILSWPMSQTVELPRVGGPGQRSRRPLAGGGPQRRATTRSITWPRRSRGSSPA